MLGRVRDIRRFDLCASADVIDWRTSKFDRPYFKVVLVMNL